MIEFVKSNPDVEKVLCTELSRIGRDPLQVLQTIETLNQVPISLYIQNYNIETLTVDKEINPLAQFLITILAEISRMEKSAIVSRLKSGYDNYAASSCLNSLSYFRMKMTAVAVLKMGVDRLK